MLRRRFALLQNAFPVWETVLHPCKMLSRFGKRLYTPAKCFPGLGNGFTPLQSAFPVWEMALHPCKVLSGLGNGFTPLQNAFPVWETTLHPCKMLSRFGKRFYIFLEIVLTKQLSFEI